MRIDHFLNLRVEQEAIMAYLIQNTFLRVHFLCERDWFIFPGYQHRRRRPIYQTACSNHSPKHSRNKNFDRNALRPWRNFSSNAGRCQGESSISLTKTSILQTTLDETTIPWGVKVERVEMKDVRLPYQLQRVMAAEAEATRDAMAKVSHDYAGYRMKCRNKFSR